jgi:hypothetical protein
LLFPLNEQVLQQSARVERRYQAPTCNPCPQSEYWILSVQSIRHHGKTFHLVVVRVRAHYRPCVPGDHSTIRLWSGRRIPPILGNGPRLRRVQWKERGIAPTRAPLPPCGASALSRSNRSLRPLGCFRDAIASPIEQPRYTVRRSVPFSLIPHGFAAGHYVGNWFDPRASRLSAITAGSLASTDVLLICRATVHVQELSLRTCLLPNQVYPGRCCYSAFDSHLRRRLV